MSPREVEQLVTFPIETAMMGIPKTIQLRSVSKLGLSLITLVLDDSVDLYFARQLVNERLREVRSRLPSGIEPVLGPVATAFGELYQFTIENPSLSLMDRKTLQDWVIRPQLRTVPGINEVNSWGGFSRQILIEADPDALQKYGLTLRDIFTRVEESNENFGGGFIDHQAEQYNVLGMGRPRNLVEIGQIVLREKGGVPVLVRDVAQVYDGAIPRQGAILRDGRGETVCGMAIMLKGENSRAVIARVKERLAGMKLPAGTRLTPFYDQSEVIETTIGTVRKNLLEAGLLVSAVLLLFLGNVRAALIVAALIPFAMICGFVGMAMFGVSANLMSLGALDFGMIVDGGVVMMENAIRRLSHDQGAPREVIRHAAKEVSRPIVFGVLIIIAVYLPILFLEDLEGRMFRPMAVAVCSALLGALLLSLTVVPVFASFVFKGRVAHAESRWFASVHRGYGRSLDWALHHAWLVGGVAVLLLAIALGSLAFIGTEFMPRLDEGAIVIQTKKLPGINVADSVEASREVEKIVLSFPEVQGIVTKLGRPDVATEAMGVYEADAYVILKPAQRWMSLEAKQTLIASMAQRLGQMPGMVFNFTQPMAMRMDEVISGVKAEVAVKIFGDDPVELDRLAGGVRDALNGVRGVADLQVEISSGVGELRIEPDRARLARFGLTIADIRDVVNAASGGRALSDYVEGQRRFPMAIRLPKQYRDDLNRLSGLIVRAPAGEQLRLGDLAALTLARGPEAVSRENGQRRMVVQCNVRGRDLGGFVLDARAAVQKKVVLPSGYWTEWGGQFENQERATRRLMILLPLSILLIVMLLYATFESWKQTLIIFLAVPFALIGGIAMLWLRGMNLNLSAGVGFIALFGVAVLNGIVLISMMNQLRREGADARRAALAGAQMRLRPVLMTALVAALGFLPMTLSTDPGAEVQRPLATVVVGGLLSSTLLTLYLLPIFYARTQGGRYTGQTEPMEPGHASIDR